MFYSSSHWKKFCFLLDQHISLALLLLCQTIHWRSPMFCSPIQLFNSLTIVFRRSWDFDWKTFSFSEVALSKLQFMSDFFWQQLMSINMVHKFWEYVYWFYSNSLSFLHYKILNSHKLWCKYLTLSLWLYEYYLCVVGCIHLTL